MKFQTQIIVLVALLVLAVASMASAEDSVGNFVRETCRNMIAQAKPRMIEMCKQAIKARAVAAVCKMMAACKNQELMEQLLKIGGLFG